MTAPKRSIIFAVLALVLVACPKEDDDKGKVPFGLDDGDKAKTVETPQAKKDAAKEASVKDAGADGGDAKVDAQRPLTPDQLFREQVLRSLRLGKLDEELKTQSLEKVRKLGALPLRGVAPPVALSRLYEPRRSGTGGDFVEPPQDASLRVRGAQGGTFSIMTKAFTPEESQSASVTDPSGQYTLVEKKVSCDGVRLIVAKSNEIVAGVLAGKPAAKPWVHQNEDPTQCNKAELEPLVFKVLGWTGQGIVFFLDGDFFVQESPLASDVAPRKLDFGPGLPAPLPSGFVAADGRTVVVPTRFGFLVYVSGQPARLVTDRNIDSSSQVAFTRDDQHLQLYWTHEGSLFHTVLPFAYGGAASP